MQATNTPPAKASQAPRMKTSNTASLFIAARNARPKPISGGVTSTPTIAVRTPVLHVHSSGWKRRELHDAAIVSTNPGPANMISSEAV